MRPYLSEFRQLFYDLVGCETDMGQVLLSWSAQNKAILESHAMFRVFNGPENPYSVEMEDLWSFYALSRVCDLLIEPLEPLDSQKADWQSLLQFVTFWEEIGISNFAPVHYHPFWCEIAAIEAAPFPGAAPQIKEVLWPALTFGDLLVCRAGVRVLAGKDILDPTICATSPLYFAYQRAARKTHDLSHGWGSNSQWRTCFRRDYLWRDSYIFNADGAPGHDEAPFLSALTWHEVMNPPLHRFFASPIGEGYGLDLQQREELLLNRSLVRHQTEYDDFWPYNDTLLLSPVG